MAETERLDKWLWAVRLFKTRGIAARICAQGRVKRLGSPLKPASPVRPGDELEVPFAEGPGVRILTVRELIQQRVGAPEARACYDDQTAPATIEARRLWQQARREAPAGRPTKKDRRQIDRARGFFQ